MEKNQTTFNKVSKALEEIRPFLVQDGGDIELIEIKENVVYVKLLGSCSECSINQQTLKFGVEESIKKHAPEISKIINVL